MASNFPYNLSVLNYKNESSINAILYAREVLPLNAGRKQSLHFSIAKATLHYLRCKIVLRELIHHHDDKYYHTMITMIILISIIICYISLFDP